MTQSSVQAQPGGTMSSSARTSGEIINTNEDLGENETDKNGEDERLGTDCEKGGFGEKRNGRGAVIGEEEIGERLGENGGFIEKGGFEENRGMGGAGKEVKGGAEEHSKDECDLLVPSSVFTGTTEKEKSECGGTFGPDALIEEYGPEVATEAHGSDEPIEDYGQDVPIDRGWAWVIAFSCFAIIFVYNSLDHAVAVLFTDILDELSCSVSDITTTLSASNIARCLATLFAANVLTKYTSVRVVAVISNAVNAACTLAFVALPNIFVFNGALFLKHTCKGLTMVTTLTLVGHYFRRRRGLATAFGLMGMSVSAMVIPPLIRALKDEYNLTSAFLLFSGIELQAIIFALLLRPLDSYTRPSKLRNLRSQEALPLTAKGKVDQQTDSSRGQAHNQQSFSYSETRQAEKLNVDDTGDGSTLQAHHQEPSSITDKIYFQHAEKSLIKSDAAAEENGYCECLDPDIQGPDENLAVERQATSSAHKMRLKRCMWLGDMLQMFQPELFRDPVCLVLCCSYALSVCLVFVLLYLPSYTETVGVAKSDAALLLTIVGVTDLAGRLLSGLLGDQRRVRPGTILAASCLVLGVACQIVGLLRSFGSLAALCVVLGMLGCFGQNMNSVHIVDVLGLSKLGSVFAMGSLFVGVAFAAGHVIHGFLIEWTGGFLTSFSVVGIGYITAAILLLCLPLIGRCQRKRHAQNLHRVKV